MADFVCSARELEVELPRALAVRPMEMLKKMPSVKMRLTV
jgi:hypothetical protein